MNLRLSLLVSLWLSVCPAVAVRAEEPVGFSVAEFVLPPDANVVNVKDFGAVGDGKTDDTAAIQSAYNHTGMIYFPNGVYLISNTIKAPARPGGVPSRRVIQGQSRNKTVIRLKDAADGFGDPSAPKPMIVTSWRIAQAFRNAVRDVTIDVGAGNAGAVALEFFASNTGHVWNVTLRSSDPAGAGYAGLNMFADSGPLLVRGLRVEGFDHGIIADCNQLATFEHVRLAGQRRIGFLSANKSIVRGLVSDNAVPAVVAGGQGFTLLDAELRAPGDSNDAAIELQGEVSALLRDVAVRGYRGSVRTSSETLGDPIVREWTSKPAIRLTDASPKGTLRLAIEETPALAPEPPEEWVPITRFAPGELWVERKGRHRKENWAVALQAAIDSGASTIYFPAGRSYLMHGDVHVRGSVKHLIGLESVVAAVDPSLSGTRLIVEGDVGDPLLIERFDSMYGRWTIEHRSKRRLVLRHLLADEIRLVPGAGDLFLDDAYSDFLDINGQNVWARSLNMEHPVNLDLERPARPNCVNAGGNAWILGLKTEQARTKVRTLQRGRSEVYAYVLANVASNPLPMFENRDGAMSVSVVESVLRRAPFSTLLEHQCGLARASATRTSLKIDGTAGAAIPLMTAGCGETR